MLPRITPNPILEFMIQGAFRESILYPTFIARPRAQAVKKSVTQGITTKEEMRLQMETIYIFLLISSMKFTSVRRRNRGSAQGDEGY